MHRSITLLWNERELKVMRALPEALPWERVTNYCGFPVFPLKVSFCFGLFTRGWLHDIDCFTRTSELS